MSVLTYFPVSLIRLRVGIVAQKSFLGHLKGGSAAWQMAWLLQSVITGIIPGNCNGKYVSKLMKVTVLY